eukprot:260623_1
MATFMVQHHEPGNKIGDYILKEKIFDIIKDIQQKSPKPMHDPDPKNDTKIYCDEVTKKLQIEEQIQEEHIKQIIFQILQSQLNSNPQIIDKFTFTADELTPKQRLINISESINSPIYRG